MLGRLDDKYALKQGYSRLLNYFSDPASEWPLTYRGELQVIHGDSIFDVGAQRDCFGFNGRYKVQYKPYYTATATRLTLSLGFVRLSRWERKCKFDNV
jgi:hypothetical protein